MRKNKWRVNLNGEIIYGYKCYNQLNNGSKRLRDDSGVASEGYCDLSEICDWKFELLARKIFSSLWGDNREAIIEAYHIYNSCYVNEREQKLNRRKELLSKLDKAKKKLDNLTNMRMEGEISKEEFQVHRQKVNVEIEAIEKSILQYENQNSNDQSGKMDFGQLSELLTTQVDFSQQKLDRQFLEQAIFRIIPYTQDEFAWYLNLLPHQKEQVDNYREICTITVEFDEARAYRKERKGMLRRNQWRDITAHIFV